MGCLAFQSADRDQLMQQFKRLYASPKVKQALFDPLASQFKKEEIIFFIYYNVSKNLLKNINAEIKKMQETIKSSQCKLTSFQKMAQFAQSIETFVSGVVQTKEGIKRKLAFTDAQLEKLNNGLNSKIMSVIHEQDNKKIVKKPQLIEQPILVKNPKADNQEFQRNLQDSREIQIEVNNQQQSVMRPGFCESALTSLQVQSNIPYRLPDDVVKIKQRQKQVEAQQKVFISPRRPGIITHSYSETINAVTKKQVPSESQIWAKNQISKLQNQRKVKQTILQERNSQILRHISKNTQLNTQLIRLQVENQQKDQRIKNLQLENEEIKALNMKLQTRLKKSEESSRILSPKVVEWASKKQFYNFDIAISQSELSKSSYSAVKQTEYQTILKYFGHSNLLPTFQDHSNAAKLRRQLSQMFLKKIHTTKLIYAFDPISQLHFNQYIQKRQNLLVLVQISKSVFIGGFAGEIDQNQEVRDSFLFSVREEKDPIKLTAKEKVKKIDYEPGFINFGNGEIKIKCRSLSLTCNVSGLYTKYFGEKPTSIERFLGGQERSLQAVGYEIYQIQFDNEL